MLDPSTTVTNYSRRTQALYLNDELSVTAKPFPIKKFRMVMSWRWSRCEMEGRASTTLQRLRPGVSITRCSSHRQGSNTLSAAKISPNGSLLRAFLSFKRHGLKQIARRMSGRKSSLEKFAHAQH